MIINNANNPAPLLNTLPSAYDPSTPGVCYSGEPFLGKLYAEDPQNDNVTYYLIEGSLPLGLGLDPALGTISGIASLYNIVANTYLDGDHTWQFAIGASDDFNNAATDLAYFTITIKHIITGPSVPPGFGGEMLMMWEGDNITNATVENSSMVSRVANGFQLTGVMTQNPSANFVYTATGLPEGIILSSIGVISGQLPPISAQYIPSSGSIFSGNITVTDTSITSQDLVNSDVSYPYSIIVNNVPVPPVWVTSANIGSFEENQAMSFTLEATDADGYSVTYSISSGALPYGLSLSSSGVISGTPQNYVGEPRQTVPVTYQFTANATVNTTDVPAGNPVFNVSKSFLIEIISQNQGPIWQTAAGSLGSSICSNPVNIQLVATDPESQPLTYTISSGSLPSGLNLSTEGIISGVLSSVTANTTSSFTVSASDGTSQTPQSFSYLVEPVPDSGPVWDTPSGSLGSGYPGAVFSYQLMAHETLNAPAPLTFANGPSPPGSLSVNSSTGLLSGALPLTPGTYNFSMSIYDGAYTVYQLFSVTVLNPPTASFTFTNSTSPNSFTVPSGVYKITLDWLVGAGGGGGSGEEYGNGGGGGGGGSGGYYENTVVACSPGDVFSFTIGHGGTGGVSIKNGTSAQVSGGNGGDTICYQNGNAIYTATGGQGGEGSINYNGGYILATGGSGGTPNGSNGKNGVPGTSDTASCPGGAGAATPYPGSVGGTAGEPYYTTDNIGGNGTGPGAGGGGGGSIDRNPEGEGSGGSGSDGIVVCHY